MDRLCATENDSMQGRNVEFKLAQNRKRRYNNANAKMVNFECSPMTLISLNYDCLEHILHDLCLEDLINVGRTCTQLKSTICRIYAFKFRKQTLLIDCNLFPSFAVSCSSLLSHQRFSTGSDIGTFLNVFGEVVPKMIISNMFPISAKMDAARLESDSKIEHLIMTYCRKHLLDIKFQNCGQHTMQGAQPFEKVIFVSFDRCIIGKRLSNFEYLFPAMQRLDLVDCNVFNVRESIEKEFPLLKGFNLFVKFGENSWKDSSYTVTNVMTAIDRNPQITKLKLCYWNATVYDARLLKYASLKLHQLNSLQLWHLRYTEFFSDGNIHFKSVQKFTLANYFHGVGRLDYNLRALSFENLNKFCMTGEFDSDCTTFIARHKTIKEVSIVPIGDHDWYPTDEDVLRIFSVLPNLQKITLNGTRITANGLIMLISQNSTVLSMIKLRRYVFSTVIRKLFKWQCANIGWSVVFNDASIELRIMTIQRKYF